MSSENSMLMQSYYLYSAILALKLLALAPLAQIVCNPEKVQRANISDLKNLTPFWLVAGLYMTTSPDEQTAITLLRLFVAARFVAAVGYVQSMPRMAVEMAFFVSFAVTSFMGGW
ncbi:microsomal glutathione S-transferase 1-like, partial [Manduca sexta]|uniref:microsomal glutathione S-transferase 1-like n=1 Tax=Manduca sexta TaxID=7130 RepID=UPI00188E2991